ncbi:oxidoreductase [Anaeromyxobacter dehalogenans]|uniref:FAD/NAD(P)-binding oxidoreductase n=1 Tax=Anaeromyxobacter dehalogenans (strain 2CP-C) TaxID=290397 RepID=Q2INY9_ANADE|nr:oxidoreductase [Anaeromyxobacter dehalogenans]ABC80523.1 FAD/NAD(P)-binding oxidoreductase [Anaeromyxobacter dehalogenans 2CP-C]
MLGPTLYTDVSVLAAWDETAPFRGIRLSLPPALARAHRAPGQVVKVRTAAGEGFFALASAPSPDAVVDLLVKRGGKVADAAIVAAAPGATLAITEPFGKGFPVEEAAGRDVLLFAAGSGIAPIRAVVQHVLAHRDAFRRVTLFYGQRHGAEFAYRAEHLAWERGGVRLVLCPSGEDDAWPGVRGRVQEVARALAFGGTPPEETVAFVSGMTAMVDDVRRVLAGAGIPPQHVFANF